MPLLPPQTLLKAADVERRVASEVMERPRIVYIARVGIRKRAITWNVYGSVSPSCSREFQISCCTSGAGRRSGSALDQVGTYASGSVRWSILASASTTVPLPVPQDDAWCAGEMFAWVMRVAGWWVQQVVRPGGAQVKRRNSKLKRARRGFSAKGL
jgi:hypothetical protein